MKEPLRFAVVGCGVIGVTHAEAIVGLADAELTAVVDPIAERARSLGDRFAVRAYTDLGTMLDREPVEVVNICTPSGLHGEAACMAMRAGRHVIVEKPLEITLDAIDRVLHTQREAGVKLAVISQRRFDPASRQIRRLIDDGAFGRLVLGNAHVPWWRSQAYYDSGEWRGTRRLDGGGVLMNQSIHSIDLLRWFMGPVATISAYTDTLAHRMETEDVAVAALRFANGALGSIVATTAAYPGVTTRIEVLGDRGSAVIENDRLIFLHLAGTQKEEVGSYGMAGAELPRGGNVGGAADPAAVGTGGHAAQIADMIRAIREDGVPAVDGQAGRDAVEIILGIYRSADTGREVRLA